MVGLCLKPCGKPVNGNSRPCQVKANLSLSVPNLGSLKTVSFPSTVAIHGKACSLRQWAVSIRPGAAAVSSSVAVFRAL